MADDAVGRAHVDDHAPARLDHPLRRLLGHVEDAGEVDRQHL